MRMYYHNSLWGILVLIADVWAIVNIMQSTADTGRKVLWTVLVVLLPVLGFVLWYFLGPKSGRS
jgi:succinate dehydrogenase/fumarate reductase cytochrome b subunit